MGALAPRKTSSNRHFGLASRIALLTIGVSVLAAHGAAPPAGATTGLRMKGGGGIYDSAASAMRVRYTFELHCDVAGLPNSLAVNWDPANTFQLETLASASCSDDSTVAGPAGFDTHSGSGIGRVNGVPGATALWTFSDAGDPGTSDAVRIEIRDANNAIVLSISGTVVRGNHQAVSS